MRASAAIDGVRPERIASGDHGPRRPRAHAPPPAPPLRLRGALAALRGPDAEAQAPPPSEGRPTPGGKSPDDLPAAVRALPPMTDGVGPITVDEHRARLARAQKLLAEAGLDAMVVGPGSSLAYFTGADWGLSERFLGDGGRPRRATRCGSSPPSRRTARSSRSAWERTCAPGRRTSRRTRSSRGRSPIAAPRPGASASRRRCRSPSPTGSARPCPPRAWRARRRSPRAAAW